MTRGNRKIGLGVMGFADIAHSAWHTYDSEEAVKVAEDVMAAIFRGCVRASAALAEERGVFPNFEGSIFSERGQRVRNATTTTMRRPAPFSINCGMFEWNRASVCLVLVRNVMDKVSWPKSIVFRTES